jgi:hypothetical protein
VLFPVQKAIGPRAVKDQTLPAAGTNIRNAAFCSYSNRLHRFDQAMAQPFRARESGCVPHA